MFEKKMLSNVHQNVLKNCNTNKISNIKNQFLYRGMFVL